MADRINAHYLARIRQQPYTFKGRTDGNPLFVMAFVDHMLSRGWILDTNPGWVLTTSPEKLPLEIPDDAQRVIEMQFERLSPADRELVEAASAAGPKPASTQL